MPLFTYSYGNRQYTYRGKHAPSRGCTEYVEQPTADPPRKYAVHWHDSTYYDERFHSQFRGWSEPTRVVGRLLSESRVLAWSEHGSSWAFNTHRDGFTAVLVQE